MKIRLIILFFLIYLFFALWMSNSIKNVLHAYVPSRMPFNSTIMPHINEEAYNKLNVYQCGLDSFDNKEPSYVYNIEKGIDFHLFLYNKVMIKHRYHHGNTGFVETIWLTIKWEDNNWRIINVEREP